jgi:hypothetical protein
VRLSTTRSRTASCLTATLALATLAGCAGQEPVQSPAVSTAPSPSATPTPTPDGVDPADEAAVLAAWDSYWAAKTAALNGPDPDPALWHGFVTDEVVAEHTALAQSYLDAGIVFTGAPVVSDVSVSWTGDVALVVACVDESQWLGTQDGAPLPPRPQDVHPVAAPVIQVGEQWQVGNGAQVPAGTTC